MILVSARTQNPALFSIYTLKADRERGQRPTRDAAPTLKSVRNRTGKTVC